MKLVLIAILILATFIFACTATIGDEDIESLTPQNLDASTKSPLGENYCNEVTNPYCEVWHLEPSEQLMLILGDEQTLW
jgi:hypothetical protein